MCVCMYGPLYKFLYVCVYVHMYVCRCVGLPPTVASFLNRSNMYVLASRFFTGPQIPRKGLQIAPGHLKRKSRQFISKAHIGKPRSLMHVCMDVCMYVCMYVCTYVRAPNPEKNDCKRLLPGARKLQLAQADQSKIAGPRATINVRDFECLDALQVICVHRRFLRTAGHNQRLLI